MMTGTTFKYGKDIAFDTHLSALHVLSCIALLTYIFGGSLSDRSWTDRQNRSTSCLDTNLRHAIVYPV